MARVLLVLATDDGQDFLFQEYRIAGLGHRPFGRAERAVRRDDDVLRFAEVDQLVLRQVRVAFDLNRTAKVSVIIGRLSPIFGPL